MARLRAFGQRLAELVLGRWIRPEPHSPLEYVYRALLRFEELVAERQVHYLGEGASLVALAAETEFFRRCAAGLEPIVRDAGISLSSSESVAGPRRGRARDRVTRFARQASARGAP